MVARPECNIAVLGSLCFGFSWWQGLQRLEAALQYEAVPSCWALRYVDFSQERFCNLTGVRQPGMRKQLDGFMALSFWAVAHHAL